MTGEKSREDTRKPQRRRGGLTIRRLKGSIEKRREERDGGGDPNMTKKICKENSSKEDEN